MYEFQLGGEGPMDPEARCYGLPNATFASEREFAGDVMRTTIGSLAATDSKDGDFDTVTAKAILVENDAGKVASWLGVSGNGSGRIITFASSGEMLVTVDATVGSYGSISTFAPSGKELVVLGAGENGGGVVVYNKTGENIISLQADDYRNPCRVLLGYEKKSQSNLQKRCQLLP